MLALELNHVSYAYQKGANILDDISMKVPNNCIYGFLGKNGAGKSTTLRLVLGLLRAQKGTIKIHGHNVREDFTKSLKSVGSLIESSSLYGHLSALDNLRLAAFGLGGIRVNYASVLERVGLGHAGKKSVKNFSTGMKQRLGLAIALIHDPKLLILDEPTNGLDPDGMAELRNILNQLRLEGKTIILSSHILSEVEKMATHIGLLRNGQIAFEGPLSELQSDTIEIRIVASSKSTLVEVLKSRNYTYSELPNEEVAIFLPAKNEIPLLIRFLVQNRIDLYQVEPQKHLEHLFFGMNLGSKN